MSSESGNKSAIETAKSSPIIARTSRCSTSGYLKLSEIRRQENSVPGDFQPVRTAEIESSLFIGMFDSHPRLVSNLRSIIHRNPRRNHSLRFPLRCSTPGMQPTRIGRSLTAMRTVPKTDGSEMRIGGTHRPSVQQSRRRMPRCRIRWGGFFIGRECTPTPSSTWSKRRRHSPPVRPKCTWGQPI